MTDPLLASARVVSHCLADHPSVEYGRTFRFTAFGEAKPQGSQLGRFVPSLGHVVKHEKRSVLDWRRQVAQAAGEAMMRAEHSRGLLIDGPCELDVTVYRPRPKSAKRSVRFPATAPDADKLLRAIGDALTGVLVRDDSRFVTVSLRKRFGEPARAEIVVREIAEAR